MVGKMSRKPSESSYEGDGEECGMCSGRHAETMPVSTPNALLR